MVMKHTRQLFGDDIARSEITPRAFFENRRRVLRAGGALAATGLIGVNGEALATMTSPDAKGQKLSSATNTKFVALDKVTPFKDITSYNNFYEFGTDKADPAHNAHTLRPRPWKISVEGEIKNAKVYDIDEIVKLAARGAYLSAAVRGRVVDGDSVDWHSAGRNHQARAADRQREVRAIHHARRSLADARIVRPHSRLAVFRRFTHGRGDESAHAADRRFVR